MSADGDYHVLTDKTHEGCGSMLYRVGSDRYLFCASCSVSPDSEEVL